MTTTEKQNTPALAVLERRRQEEAERKAQIEARIAARRRAKAEHDAQFITISMLVHRFMDAHPAPGISYGMIVFETLRSDDRHDGGITPLFCRWAAWRDWTDGRDERNWHPDDARWTPLPPCPVTCFCRSREGEGAILGQEYTHVENRHTEKRGNCTITAPDPLLSALARYGFDVELLAKLGNGRGGSFNAEALAIRVEDAARLFGPEVVAEPAVRPSASAPAGADPEPVAAPAVAVVPDSASVPASTPEPMAQQWSLKKPKRFPGYRLELRDFLEVARTAGNPEPPTVQDVLDAWNTCRPHGITRVMPDGFEYLDAKSKTKEADRDAIRKAIDRLVIRTTFGR